MKKIKGKQCFLIVSALIFIFTISLAVVSDNRSNIEIENTTTTIKSTD